METSAATPIPTSAAGPAAGDAPPADPAMMREWRRRARWAAWVRAPQRPGGRPRLVRTALGRVVRTGRAAYEAARQPIAVAAEREGMPRWRQALQAWRWGIVSAMDPRLFYRHQLHRTGRARRAHGFVTEQQLLDVVHMISRTDAARARQVTADKVAFEAWCTERGIPTVGALVRAEAGAIVVGSPDDLPDADLFSKLTHAYGGTGARRWTRVAPGRWRPTDEHGATDAADVDRAGLCAAVTAQSAAAGMPALVQRALTNHPALAHLTSGGLATLRHVTLRALDGAVATTSAVYRMPTGGSIIDAFSHGGLAAVVDRATGALGAATNNTLAMTDTWVETHPDTGGRIPGTVLPWWPEIEALVLRAHADIPGAAPLIGWDIAVTADGPVVIEANIPPSSALQQVPTRTPLGETPVVPTLLAYLRAAYG